MNSKWIAGMLLSLAVVMAACGGNDAGDVDTPPSAAAERASSAASNAAAGLDDDLQEFTAFRLTMPTVRRWFEAQEHIYRAMGENPDLADEVDSSHVRDTDGLVAHFNGIPEVRAAVSRAGLTMRQYTEILGTFYYVRGVDAAIQGGADRAALLANQQVDPENLEFVEQNRSELDRLQNRLEALEADW